MIEGRNESLILGTLLGETSAVRTVAQLQKCWLTATAAVV
jgi:hypothetical protein